MRFGLGAVITGGASWFVKVFIAIPVAVIAPMMSLRMQLAGEDAFWATRFAKYEPQIRRDLDIGDKVRRAAIPLPAVTTYTVAIAASRIRWWLDLKSPTAYTSASGKPLVAVGNPRNYDRGLPSAAA